MNMKRLLSEANCGRATDRGEKGWENRSEAEKDCRMAARRVSEANQTCKLMDKNRIEGRRGTTSWHNTAKSSGLPVEVNAAVVQGAEAQRRQPAAGSPKGGRSPATIVQLPGEP